MEGTGGPVLSRSGASIPRSLLQFWRRRRPESASNGNRQATDPLPAAGRQLRQRREERGLTLRQLAQSTRISTAVLEALERGWSDRLPEAAYLRTMVPLLEAQLDLPQGSLASALPDPRRATRRRLGHAEVAPDAIELVGSWQGSLVYALLTLGLIYGLNLEHQRQAAQGLLALRPIPALPAAEQKRQPSAAEALLQAHPDLRPLDRAARGVALGRLASEATAEPRSQGILDLELLQSTRISLSSDAGLRTELDGASGMLSLPISGPFSLRLEPAPSQGSRVLWNGSPLAPRPGHADQFAVPAPRPAARSISP